MAVVSCGFMAAEILLVLLLSAVLIALLVRYSVHLSRSVAQPVVDLSRRAEDVIGGDLTVREPVRSETYEIRTLSEGMEQMIARLNAQIQETTQKQASLRKAELALLQAQINPHFLYNTMDTIIWLIEANRPQAAVDWVKAHAPQISRSAILVDLCGVKRVVVEQIAPVAEEHGFAYIGGHPMAGKERGGFTASADDLYVGASMILTPDKRTDMKLLETLQAFFLDLGFARLTFSQPEEHDRIIAFTSQLAHIVSSAYVKSPEAQRRRGFSAGSFRDMTRVARLDEDMWTELFLDDADYLVKELDILIENLTAYSQALKSGDAERVRALLREGREKKAAAGGN